MDVKKAPPVEGAERERVVFAWYPITIDDGSTVWLERVRLTEEWSTQYSSMTDVHWGYPPVSRWWRIKAVRA